MSRIVGYDEDGNPSCLCDDGNIYVDCGRNCGCCDYVDTDILHQQSYTIYETTSCPCGFYALENNFGKIECERQGFEANDRVAPIKVNNHHIDSTAPLVGEQWDCVDTKTCSQGAINWQALHIISIETSVVDKFTKVTNTNSSTSNCYIPRTMLSGYQAYGADDTRTEYGAKDALENVYGSDISDVERFIDGFPLYKDKQDALIWDLSLGSKTGEVSEYLERDGTTKYIPGHYRPDKKLITGCYVNSEDILLENINQDWGYTSYESTNNKFTVPVTGSNLKIKIKGDNNPVVDICIKNSSGRTILSRKLVNITINGEYILNQKIPALLSDKSSGSGKIKESEYYNIKITPSADTSYYYEGFVPTGVLNFTVWQFKDVTFTFKPSLASDLTFSNATINGGAELESTVSGTANSFSNETLTLTTTVERSSGSDHYYLKPVTLGVRDHIIHGNTTGYNNSIIKKTIIDQEDKKELESRSDITVAETDTNANRGDLKPGMKLTGEIRKTKTLFKSIHLDENLVEGCDDDVMFDILTNKFEIENTTDLFEGMGVAGLNSNGNEFESTLHSVDCDKTITLASHHVVENETLLTFVWSDSSIVVEVNENKIKLLNSIRLPNNTELTFNKAKKPEISGTIRVDNTCTSPITITTVIDSFYFGQDEVTYTLDVDSIITNKPPVLDKYVVVEKNSKNNLIDVGVLDLVSSGLLKSRIGESSFTIGSARNGVASESAGQTYYITYIPVEGYTGKDKITYTFNDGVNDSDEKTIFITVK